MGGLSLEIIFVFPVCSFGTREFFYENHKNEEEGQARRNIIVS